MRLKWPRLQEIGLAALLAVLLLPPVAYASVEVLTNYPHVARLLERQPLVEELRSVIEGRELNDAVPYLLGLALLPALSEELCFRGFLLSGMLKSFRPRTAVLLVSFLFALYHMNVFMFLPAFFIGVVLGLADPAQPQPGAGVRLSSAVQDGPDCGPAGLWQRTGASIPQIVKDLWLPFVSAGPGRGAGAAVAVVPGPVSGGVMTERARSAARDDFFGARSASRYSHQDLLAACGASSEEVIPCWRLRARRKNHNLARHWPFFTLAVAVEVKSTTTVWPGVTVIVRSRARG